MDTPQLPEPEPVQLDTWPAWNDWLHQACEVLTTLALIVIAITLVVRL